MRTEMRTWMVVGLLGAAVSAPVAAQSPPPVQGTIALEGTMTKFYRGVNAIVVTTIDGAEHVYRFAKGLVVHGTKGPDALETLRPGTTVIVHYRIEGAEESVEEIDRVADDGLKITEGTVLKLDRRRQQITLRFGNGSTETLRLTERAAGQTDETISDAGATSTGTYTLTESRLANYIADAFWACTGSGAFTFTPPNQLTWMIAKQTTPIAGVMNISSAGFMEMKVIDTPASAPSSAALGVILLTIGARKPPAISTKLWMNTHARPASQPLTGS